MVCSISGISSRAFSSFCREKLEYPNIITTASGGSTRPPWSSNRRCFPPWSCSCGRCFPWECSRSRGLSKGSPARSLSMRAHECGRGAECPPGQGAADLQRAVYMGGCLRHRPVRIRLQGSEPGTVCQSFLGIKTPHRTKRCGKLVDLEGFEPLTSRMRTERSPSNIAFVHTFCTARKEKSTYIRLYKMFCHPNDLSRSQVWSPSR